MFPFKTVSKWYAFTKFIKKIQKEVDDYKEKWEEEIWTFEVWYANGCIKKRTYFRNWTHIDS